MPRICHYPLQYPKFSTIEGHSLTIEPLNAIAWYLPSGQGSYRQYGKLMLISLPCGRESLIYWSTLRNWIGRGSVKVGSGYLTWQDAALALYPKDAVELLGAAYSVYCQTP